MFQSTSPNDVQNHAVKEFSASRIRASLDAWLAKLLLKNNGLRSLVGSNVSGLQAKRLECIQRIRVDKIIGTIRYTDDFDQSFRPLKKQLRDRWVRALLQLEEHGWQPIVVHKVGESYYVANGHHQVSVARHVGMKFIEAEVWDHCSCQTSHDQCAGMQQMPRRQRKSLSTN